MYLGRGGGHREPLIARWPEKIPPGTICAETICLNDLMATCASIVGEDLPSDAARSAYHVHCANCHGESGEGRGDVPELANGPTPSASDGELFWYTPKGDAGNGMPSWEFLSPVA